MPSPRALLVIPSLRGGGAERVFTLLLNGLSQQGFEMHVALCQCEGYWLERLAPAVTVHDLKSPRVRQAGWPIARLVRSLRPTTVLSTSSHLNTVVGLFRPLFPRGTRLLLRDVNAQHLEPSQLKGFRAKLLRRAYRSADSVICLVDSARPVVADTLSIAPDRIIRIFNPVDRSAEVVHTSPLRNRNPRGRNIVSIGSLNPWKGFDRLIDAFPALLKRFPESTLTILGEGNERASLETQIERLQLADRIRMPGFSSNVRSSFDAADLFVLASRFEGMPNVLLEAIDARCPFVTTDHPGGTREVLELLEQQQRITTDLSEWRDDWFAPVSSETHQAARLHFGLEEILHQYVSVLFPSRRAGVARPAKGVASVAEPHSNPSPRHATPSSQASPPRGEGGRRPDEGTIESTSSHLFREGEGPPEPPPEDNNRREDELNPAHVAQTLDVDAASREAGGSSNSRGPLLPDAASKEVMQISEESCLNGPAASAWPLTRECHARCGSSAPHGAQAPEAARREPRPPDVSDSNSQWAA